MNGTNSNGTKYWRHLRWFNWLVEKLKQSLKQTPEQSVKTTMSKLRKKTTSSVYMGSSFNAMDIVSLTQDSFLQILKIYTRPLFLVLG